MKKKSEFDFINRFPPLGHPDHHFMKYPDHPWLRTKWEIINWLEKNKHLINGGLYTNTFYKVFEDLTVYTTSDIVFKENNNISFLPFQIRKSGEFKLRSAELSSLIGTPYVCPKIDVSNNELSSLEGLGATLREIIVTNNNLINYIGMPELKYKNVVITVDRNNILSWDGFTNAEQVEWSQDTWEGSKSEDLLFNLPKSIKSVRFLNSFEMPYYKMNDNEFLNVYTVSRDKINEIKNVFQNKKRMELLINEDQIKEKRRKL